MDQRSQLKKGTVCILTDKSPLAVHLGLVNKKVVVVDHLTGDYCTVRVLEPGHKLSGDIIHPYHFSLIPLHTDQACNEDYSVLLNKTF